MSSINKRIVVVGGGIAGLAAALTLKSRGAEVEVLERSPLLEEVGAGLQVSPNAFAVLARLGLTSEALARGVAPDALEIRDHRRGHTLMRFEMGPQAVTRYGHPYLHLHRADLHNILLRAARAADIPLRTGVAIDAVARTKTGLELMSNGTAQAGGDLAIGADGVRSVLRTALVGENAVQFTGQVAYRGTIPASRLPDGFVPQLGAVYVGPGRHIVIYRLRGGDLVNFVAVEERPDWTAEGWSLPADPNSLRAAYAGWCDDVEKVLSVCDSTFLWGLFAHAPLPAWHNDRMALLGDAAHPMLPFLAQGAAMALEDAWALAACLAKNSEPKAGFEAYQALRRPRASRVQAQSMKQARLYHMPATPKRAVMHLGMRLVDGLLPSFGVRQMDWLYGYDITKVV